MISEWGATYRRDMFGLFCPFFRMKLTSSNEEIITEVSFRHSKFKFETQVLYIINNKLQLPIYQKKKKKTQI